LDPVGYFIIVEGSSGGEQEQAYRREMEMVAQAKVAAILRGKGYQVTALNESIAKKDVYIHVPNGFWHIDEKKIGRLGHEAGCETVIIAQYRLEYPWETWRDLDKALVCKVDAWWIRAKAGKVLAQDHVRHPCRGSDVFSADPKAMVPESKQQWHGVYVEKTTERTFFGIPRARDKGEFL